MIHFQTLLSSPHLNCCRFPTITLNCSLVAIAWRHECFSCNEPGLSSYVWPHYGVRFRLSEHHRNRWKEISIKEVMWLVQIAWLKKLYTELLRENFNRNGALPNLEVIHFWSWSRSRNFCKDFLILRNEAKLYFLHHIFTNTYQHTHFSVDCPLHLTLCVHWAILISPHICCARFHNN